jgi:hypothetical protein
MKKQLLTLVALAGLFRSAVPAAAQVSVINISFPNNTSRLTSNNLSFDVGSGNIQSRQAGNDTGTITLTGNATSVLAIRANGTRDSTAETITTGSNCAILSA